MQTCHTAIIKHLKKQKAARLILAAFYRHAVTTKAFTFRDSRQKQSTSCDRMHDGQPIRGDRSLLPFSRGSHACSHDDGCVAGMFFSFSYLCFNYYYFCNYSARASYEKPPHRLVCKVTHIFRTYKDLCRFSYSVFCFRLLKGA